MLRRFVAFLALAFALNVAAGQEFNEQAVKSVMSKVMRCQKLRLLHLAVVKADRQVLKIRLRLQDDGTVVDFNEQTLLSIASISKGMFATALPIIQDDLRRIKNDPNFNLLTTPIKNFLGDDFWYLDLERSEQVTLQDLVSHTTGFNRHDSLLSMGGYADMSEAVRKIGRLKPAADFRASFIYNNLAFVIANSVVQSLTGRNFTSYMRHYLWQAINMTNAAGNSELPTYVPSEDDTRPRVDRVMDLAEAAGGIFVSIDDMIQYMMYHVRNEYRPNSLPNPPFVSVNSVWQPYIQYDKVYFHDNVTDLPDIDYQAYGYGWERNLYRDNLLFMHGGVINNYRAHLSILPKLRTSVFTHISLGSLGSGSSSGDSLIQSIHASLLNSFLLDLALKNSSFITEENVCSIYKRLGPDPLTSMRKRQLTGDEESACTGSFGNYGSSSISIGKNSSSGLLNLQFGFYKVQLLPISHYESQSGFLEFLAEILEPQDPNTQSAIVNSTDSHFLVRASASSPPPFYLICDTTAASVQLLTPFIDPDIRFVKGLDPDSWVRPSACPQPKSATHLGLSRTLLLISVTLLVTGRL